MGEKRCFLCDERIRSLPLTETEKRLGLGVWLVTVPLRLNGRTGEETRGRPMVRRGKVSVPLILDETSTHVSSHPRLESRRVSVPHRRDGTEPKE